MQELQLCGIELSPDPYFLCTYMGGSRKLQGGFHQPCLLLTTLSFFTIQSICWCAIIRISALHANIKDRSPELQLAEGVQLSRPSVGKFKMFKLGLRLN